LGTGKRGDLFLKDWKFVRNFEELKRAKDVGNSRDFRFLEAYALALLILFKFREIN